MTRPVRCQSSESAGSIRFIGGRRGRIGKGFDFVVVRAYRRDAVLSQEPAAQVHKLAAFGAERPPATVGGHGLLADGTDVARRGWIAGAHFDFLPPPPRPDEEPDDFDDESPEPPDFESGLDSPLEGDLDSDFGSLFDSLFDSDFESDLEPDFVSPPESDFESDFESELESPFEPDLSPEPDSDFDESPASDDDDFL